MINSLQNRNIMNYKEAWIKYYSVKNWKEAGKHVDWSYSIENDTLYLYLQGSYESIDWLRDFMFLPVRIKWMNTVFWIHRGFAEMVEDLYSNKDFQSIFNFGMPVNLVLIGHSSGGAMAIIMSLIELLDFKSIKIYTFGAPRPFWIHSMPELYKKCTVSITNVRIKHDLVPYLLLPFGYRKNTGEPVVLKSVYHNFIKNHYPDTYNKVITESA